jgi:hypothetical protein
VATRAPREQRRHEARAARDAAFARGRFPDVGREGHFTLHWMVQRRLTMPLDTPGLAAMLHDLEVAKTNGVRKLQDGPYVGLSIDEALARAHFIHERSLQLDVDRTLLYSAWTCPCAL